MTDQHHTYPNEPRLIWELEELNQLLLWCTDNHVSDVSLSSGAPIRARILGNWYQITGRILGNNEIETLLMDLYRSNSASAELRGKRDVDFYHEIKRDRFTKVRFRCNATGMRIGWSFGVDITLRTIPSEPPKLEALSPEAMILDAVFPQGGLVIMSGVMGTGKSTFMAACIREIIETQARRVLTYEAPIEFDLMSFENAVGHCIQTEIGEHLEHFYLAPRNAARRAADVIFVGEARDKDTFSSMLESAEIGVAVYATLHTNSVAEVPTRIINSFEHNRQQIATTLLSQLKLIIQQRLVPKVGGGRVAIREILALDSLIRNELLKAPLDKLIPELNRFVAERGQPLIEDARQKYEEGLISRETLSLLRKEQG